MPERAEIPAVRVGRQWRFRKRDIDNWLETQRAHPEAAFPQPIGASARKRVLVVDDEESIRELLSKTLALREEYEVVNLDALGEKFDAGTEVTPDLLREQGLVARSAERIKVLARGDISKALTVRAHKFSGKAAEKIAAAGGKAEVLA